MKKLLLLCLVIFSTGAVNAELIINEIMYNPAGTDSKHEWIELYNDGAAEDITGWRLLEGNVKHTLSLVNGSFLIEDYAVIVQDPGVFLQEYPGYNGTLIDSAFSLSNTEDSFAILDSGFDVVDNVTYNDSIGGDNNGRTLVRYNDSFVESGEVGGTPGRENGKVFLTSSGQDLRIEGYIDDIAYIEVSQEKLFKIINVNPSYGIVYNISVEYNISKNGTLVEGGSFVKDKVNRYSTTSTGYFLPTEAGNYTLCGRIANSSADDLNWLNDIACKEFTVIDTRSTLCNISLNLSLEKEMFQEGEKISYEPILNDETYPFIISYGIVDLYGSVKKRFINTTNTKTKTWTPKIDEVDRVFKIKMGLVYVACNDTNKTDNSQEEMIIVNASNEQGVKETNTSIEIKTINLGSDNVTKFGQLVNVKLDIYKGDETKDAVKMYVEDSKGTRVSQVQTSFSLYDKFTRYVLTVPVQLKLNCNRRFDDGVYELVVEGLGVKEKKGFMIKGITETLCQNEGVDEETGETKKIGLNYNIKDYSKNVKPGKEVTATVNIDNDDNEVHKVELWSYVFKGRKSYSGEKEANLESFSLNENDEVDVVLKDTLSEDIEPGEYTLRVSIRKDNQKTVKNLDETVIVEDTSKVKIKSFYTMAKKPSPRVNLFTSLEGEGKANLVLYSFLEKIEKEVDLDENEKITLPVKLNSGRNLFFLAVKKNEVIKDIKQMVVDVDDDSLESYVKEDELYALSKGDVASSIPVQNAAERIVENFVEKDVIYESTTQKAKRLMPFLMIGFLGLMCLVLIFRKV